MDVVSDGGAVARREVRAEDRDVRSLLRKEGGLHQDWDDPDLLRPRLAEHRIRRAAGDVEVAQRCHAKLLALLLRRVEIVVHQELHRKLRLAVRTGRAGGGRLLGDRHQLRRHVAVRAARRRENKPLHAAGRLNALEQADRLRRVVLVVGEGPRGGREALAQVGERREVDARVQPVLGDHALHELGVAAVALHEDEPLGRAGKLQDYRQRLALARRVVVDPHHIVAGAEERADGVRADVARGPGDQGPATR
mmetsp:Transcript_12165/g.30714  ORF Transcript_12165/g.30714 Transcript_12165/m.30714 type:complete len:251 (-) Transcript_12165:86-838(-)